LVLAEVRGVAALHVEDRAAVLQPGAVSQHVLEERRVVGAREKDGVRYGEQSRSGQSLEDSQTLLEVFEARPRGEVSHRDHESRAAAVGEEEPQRVVEMERGGARTSE